MKDQVQSGYKPIQDDVLKTLGLAMIAGQGVERLLSNCLTFLCTVSPFELWNRFSSCWSDIRKPLWDGCLMHCEEG